MRPVRPPASRPPSRPSSRRAARPTTPAQEALQVTWVLKGHLKNAQVAYIRVGVLLARVRDEKLYAALRHPDLESYAARRLGLQRSSLYRYLQIHDWVAGHHPAWLEPRPRGFIPSLTDAFALMWIEKRLARGGLEPERRAALEELRQKALAGQLAWSELQEFRAQGRPRSAALRSFLRRLQAAFRAAGQLESVPPEVRECLRDAVARVAEALQRKRARPRTAARRIRAVPQSVRARSRKT